MKKIALPLLCLSLLTLFIFGAPLLADVNKTKSTKGLIESCRLFGTVQEINERTDSSVPSTIAETYYEATLTLESAEPYKKRSVVTEDASRCDALNKNGLRVIYRLCSTTPLKKGDYITGVDGGLITTQRLCLFDVMMVDAYMRSINRKPTPSPLPAE
jgi:hypothetical protein